MDLLLLLVQVVLVVLLVVIPLFSGYDKWKGWSPQRKLVGVALAVGIAVVAFGQYRRLVRLHDDGVKDALGNVGLFKQHGAWYARRVGIALWEWLGTVLAGSAMIAVAIDAGRRKKWPLAVAAGGLFLLLLVLGTLLKLRGWKGE